MKPEPCLLLDGPHHVVGEATDSSAQRRSRRESAESRRRSRRHAFRARSAGVVELHRAMADHGCRLYCSSEYFWQASNRATARGRRDVSGNAATTETCSTRSGARTSLASRRKPPHRSRAPKAGLSYRLSVAYSDQVCRRGRSSGFAGGRSRRSDSGPGRATRQDLAPARVLALGSGQRSDLRGYA